ncbi:MAG TPA: hypothetical protein DHW49_07755 [Anaerolineae bacterium]|nr:hypothetical protein [Anaerolineae bacterium]
MPISLGIYDVFANLLPGVLYLFAINEILRAVGAKHMELNNQTFTLESFIILALGYLLGHIFNNFTYRGWFRLFYRYPRGYVRDKGKSRDENSPNEQALGSLKRLYPDLNIKFYARDADLLFNAIQIKNKELADRIETTRANAIMMRNISFGLFLLAIGEFIIFINEGFSLTYLGIVIACLLGSRISLAQTWKYYEWFYKDVFRTAITYGDSLDAVIKKIRGDSKPKSR